MSKNCLIFETSSSIKNLKLSENGGLVTLSGVFGECGVRNRNQRVYEKSNYGAMVAELQKRISEEGGVPGTLEHENTMYVSLENISHKITKVNIDENGLVTGTIQLLNTPKGKIAQAIVEGGLPLFISSRASGQVDKNGNVKLEQLVCYDLVSQPGFANAKLHLNESQVMESLGDNCCVISSKGEEGDDDDDNVKTTADPEDMNEELIKRLEALEERIDELESENQVLESRMKQITKEAIDKNTKRIAEGIQEWMIEEFSPEIEKWIVNEFKPEAKKDAVTECKRVIVKQVAPLIEKWVIEEFSPEIEKWVVEEYSPEVENWFIKQVAPGIQEWMIEEFAPEVEKWVVEEYGAETRSSKLKSISDTLSMLESMTVAKPAFGNRVITEANNEPAYIKDMPESARVQYNMASKEVKESIARRARLFNFNSEGAIERFWENINFEDIKPATNIYEGLDNITDQRERQIREGFRRRRAGLI